MTGLKCKKLHLLQLIKNTKSALKELVKIALDEGTYCLALAENLNNCSFNKAMEDYKLADRTVELVKSSCN